MSEADDRIEEHNDRKWAGFVAMTMLTTLLLLAERIEPEHWADTTPWFFFIAAGAEVGQRMIDRKGKL